MWHKEVKNIISNGVLVGLYSAVFDLTVWALLPGSVPQEVIVEVKGHVAVAALWLQLPTSATDMKYKLFKYEYIQIFI